MEVGILFSPEIVCEYNPVGCVVESSTHPLELVMTTMKQILFQEENEQRYSRKHIDGYIREAIQNSPDMQARMQRGVELINDYIGAEYYESKMKRIAQLDGLDIPTLVLDMFVGVAYCLKEELFTSVTAQMASRLKFSDKTEAIRTVAELMAVLCQTDAFDIAKVNKMASLMVISRIPLEDKLLEFIKDSAYLPPMVCEPLELTNNFSSGYLSHNDSLILGTGNHHDGDICLDVLNTMNKVALQLDTDFLSTVEEEPTFDLDTAEKMQQWLIFKKQSYEFYTLMARQGNNFYLTHKVDKRGRAYCSGYHISTQGTSFKKACINLAREELVTGAPSNI